jgi:hypothetical protein
MNTNFAGLNGFIWWIGVIENRVDPLALGRCQVRIFGWHNENSVTLPTSDLPWAQAILPINSRGKVSSPRVGDWVMGFFLDGMGGQAPCMLGVFNGLNAQTSGLGINTK